jgi:hypothetical protein
VLNSGWQSHVPPGSLPFDALFAWLISHQSAVLFSQNKPATSNKPTVFFSQNKQHQPSVTSQRNSLLAV